MIFIVSTIIVSTLIISALVGARMLEAKTGVVHPRIEKIRTAGDRALAGGMRRMQRVSKHAVYAVSAHGFELLEVFVRGMVSAASHATVVVWKVVRGSVDLIRRSVHSITPSKDRTVGKASTTRYTIS